MPPCCAAAAADAASRAMPPLYAMILKMPMRFFAAIRYAGLAATPAIRRRPVRRHTVRSTLRGVTRMPPRRCYFAFAAAAMPRHAPRYGASMIHDIAIAECLRHDYLRRCRHAPRYYREGQSLKCCTLSCLLPC